jgi:hypothetical protein
MTGLQEGSLYSEKSPYSYPPKYMKALRIRCWNLKETGLSLQLPISLVFEDGAIMIFPISFLSGSSGWYGDGNVFADNVE